MAPQQATAARRIAAAAFSRLHRLNSLPQGSAGRAGRQANKHQSSREHKNFDVVDVHGRETGTHPHEEKAPPSHSALASNPRKESACVSVAAVRAKIE